MNTIRVCVIVLVAMLLSGFSFQTESTAKTETSKGWAKTWGGVGHEETWGVCPDGAGNVFVSGCFNGVTDFDPGPREDIKRSWGNSDAYLSKFDSDGNFQWVRTWGSKGDDYGRAVAVDISGCVFISGLFSSSCDFDPGTGEEHHHSNGGYDIYLSKFDGDGNLSWVRTFGGQDNEDVFYIATDRSGNVFMTGGFVGAVDFDPGERNESRFSNGGMDVFVVKFDTDGNMLWVRVWGGPKTDVGCGVGCDASGNVYISGWFQSENVDFDPGAGIDAHYTNGGNDIFACKYDHNGIFKWARTWGGLSNDSSNQCAIDDSGNMYLVGAFQGDVDFDPGSGSTHLFSIGGSDAYLAKLTSDGNFAWARAWGGLRDDDAAGVATNGAKAIVIGRFRERSDLEPGSGIKEYMSFGGEDTYLMSFDSGGRFEWVRTWGGPDDDFGFFCAIDDSGSIYFTGHFASRDIDMDPGSAIDKSKTNGAADAWLVKVSGRGEM